MSDAALILRLERRAEIARLLPFQCALLAAGIWEGSQLPTRGRRANSSPAA